MVWLIIIPSLLVFVYCFSKPVKDFVDKHLLRCTLGWCQEAFAPQQFNGDQNMWKRLKAWLASIFARKPVEASKPEVATPVPPTPVKPAVEPPMKPVAYPVTNLSQVHDQATLDEYRKYLTATNPGLLAYTVSVYKVPDPNAPEFGPLAPVIKPEVGQVLEFTGERLKVQMTKGVPVQVHVVQPWVKRLTIVGVEGGFDADFSSSPAPSGVYGGNSFDVPANRIVTIYASKDVKLAHIN